MPVIITNSPVFCFECHLLTNTTYLNCSWIC